MKLNVQAVFDSIGREEVYKRIEEIRKLRSK